MRLGRGIVFLAGLALAVAAWGATSDDCAALDDPAARLACHDRRSAAGEAGPCAPISDSAARLACEDSAARRSAGAAPSDGREDLVSAMLRHFGEGRYRQGRAAAETLLARLPAQDPQAQAETATWLAEAYVMLGEPLQSLELLQAAAALCTADRCDAWLLALQASIRTPLLRALGAAEEATQQATQALQVPLAPDDDSTLWRGMQWMEIARARLGEGDVDGARQASGRADGLFAELLRRRPGDASRIDELREGHLTALALTSIAVGRYDAAFEAIERATRIADRTATEPAAPDEARQRLVRRMTLHFVHSQLYEAMGDTPRALAELDEATARLDALAGSVDKLRLHETLPIALYLQLGRTDRARELADQADRTWAPLLAALGDAGAVRSLAYLADIRLRLGQDDDAARLLAEAAPRVEDNPRVPPTFRIGYRLAAGRLAMARGRDDEAARQLRLALQDALGLRSDPDTVEASSSLGELHRRRGDAGPAMLYMKLAVNASQRLRLGGRHTEADLQRLLTRKLEPGYHQLAGLLLDAGRLVEAEQVLLALKDIEYQQFLRRDSRAGAAPAIDSTAAERAVLDPLNEQADRLSGLYRQLLLGPADGTAKTAAWRARLEEQRDRLQWQMLAGLEALPRQLRQAAAPQRGQALPESPTEVVQLLRAVRREAGEPDAVVAMYVLGDEATTLLLVGAQGPVALRLPVDRATLVGHVRALRMQLQARADYQPDARVLHALLIAPLDAQLARQGLQPRTLMLYLTDELRYLPFAALLGPDGRHLTERYRLAVFTAAARARLAVPAGARWSVTAFGTTRAFADAPALPAVREELEAIVRAPGGGGVLPGHVYLDERFNREAWREVLNGRSVEGGPPDSVLHVATHFQVGTGDWQSSSFLMGDGYAYRLDELAQSQLSARLEEYDLIVLSACRTEFSDRARGAEFEGLGALLQQMGARAVIGTLWPVQDEGTARFMQAFYGARGEDRRMSKAQALQQAQLALLQGRVTTSRPGLDLRHPYYWAPFVLMGNWF